MQKKFWGIFGKWAGHAQTIFGYLPGPVLAAVTWSVGMIAQMNPFWLWMGTIVSAFIGHFGWVQIKSRVYAHLFVAAVMISAISFLSLAVYQRHEAYQNYEIDLGDVKLSRQTRALGTVDAVVVRVQMTACIDNNNDFPVYAKLTRNYFSLAERTSGDMDDLAHTVMKIAPGACIGDYALDDTNRCG